MLWKEKERSRIRTVQMDNLRGLLVIRRMDRILNAQMRELYGVMKGLMRVFSSGLGMWRECKMIELLRESM